MTPVILTVFLAFFVFSSKSTPLPVDHLVDEIQNFLTASEETGLRLKRSPTEDWDRELDIESLGILLRIKYNDRNLPFKGGRAHVKFPGNKFLSSLPFDDVELDIEFNFGDIINSGLFDIKVDYKFVQKFVYMADKQHEGSFLMYRRMEDGLWKTKVTMDHNNLRPRPYFDILIESDRNTEAHVIFKFGDDKWEFKILQVYGESITVGVKINDVHYTGRAVLNMDSKKLSIMADKNGEHLYLNFVLNPNDNWGIIVTGNVYGPLNFKWIMRPDFKRGDILLKYNNNRIAIVHIAGEAEMAIYLPATFNYNVKYNIDDNGRTHKGQFKFRYDGKTNVKKFRLTGQPKDGKNLDWTFEVDISSGLKYVSDVKLDGTSVEVFNGDIKWTNDESKFELESTETFEQMVENPFYMINHKYLFFFRRNLDNWRTTRKIFFEKQNTFWEIIRIMFEEKLEYDDKIMYNIKLDTTVPEKTFKVSYLPITDIEPWGLEFTLFYDNEHVNIDQKVTHGTKPMCEFEWMLNVGLNDPETFEMDVDIKNTLAEDFPLFYLTKVISGRYYNTAERHLKIRVDHTKKNLYVFPVLALKDEVVLQGEKFREIEFDNTNDLRSFKVFWQPDSFTKAYNFEHTWQISGGLEQGLQGSGSGSWNWELKRGDVSLHKYGNTWSWYNGDDKVDVEMNVDSVLTEDSPLYGWGPLFFNRYFFTRQRNFKATYDKQNRNILIGKIMLDDTMNIDGKMFSSMKLDTTSNPNTFDWDKPLGMDYQIIISWNIDGGLQDGSGTWSSELIRQSETVHMYDNQWTWYQDDEAIQVEMEVDANMKETSPLYSWGPYFYGLFFTRRHRNLKLMFNKVFNDIDFEDTTLINNEVFSSMKLDTSNPLNTFVWDKPLGMDYHFVNNWQIAGGLESGSGSVLWNWELKQKDDESLHKYNNELKWELNRGDTAEVTMKVDVALKETSPLYQYLPYFFGKFFTKRSRNFMLTYDKENNNMLLGVIPYGKIKLVHSMTLDEELFSSMTLDTVSIPHTFVWDKPFGLEDYNFIHSFEIDGGLNHGTGSGSWNWEIHTKGGEALHTYDNGWTWYHGDDKIEVEMTVDVSLTRASPLYNMCPWVYGRFFTTRQRDTKITYDKQHENIFNIVFDDIMTIDGDSYSILKLNTASTPYTLELTVPAIDKFSKSYKMVHSWDFGVDITEIEWNPLLWNTRRWNPLRWNIGAGNKIWEWELSRGEVSIHKYENQLSYNFDGAQIEIVINENGIMTEDSPLYEWGPLIHGTFFTKGQRNFQLSYNKQSGNIIFNNKLLMDDKNYSTIAIDTTSIPYTMVWHQAASGSLVPSIKVLTGHDEVTTRIWPIQETGYKMETIFGENYKFIQSLETVDEEEYTVMLSWELQKEDMSLHKYDNTLSWFDGEEIFDVEMNEEVSLTRESPLYRWGDCLYGKYFTSRNRKFTFNYDKIERNLVLEHTMTMNNEAYSTMTLDTTTIPHTFVWNQQHTGYFAPNLKQYVLDEDTLSMSLWNTPNVEIKLETNIPKIETFKIDIADETKKVELNGIELMTVDYTLTPPTLSKTFELDNGEQLMMSLSWPKLEMEASDFVVYLEYAPFGSIEGDMGWQYKAYSPNTIYMDFKCNSSYLATEYNWGFTKIDGVFLPH